MLFWSKFPISTWVHFLLQVTISPKNLFLNNSLRKARPISKSASHQMPLNRKVATYAPIRGAPAWPCAKKTLSKIFWEISCATKTLYEFQTNLSFLKINAKSFCQRISKPAHPCQKQTKGFWADEADTAFNLFQTSKIKKSLKLRKNLSKIKKGLKPTKNLRKINWAKWKSFKTFKKSQKNNLSKMKKF